LSISGASLRLPRLGAPHRLTDRRIRPQAEPKLLSDGEPRRKLLGLDVEQAQPIVRRLRRKREEAPPPPPLVSFIAPQKIRSRPLALGMLRYLCISRVRADGGEQRPEQLMSCRRARIFVRR